MPKKAARKPRKKTDLDFLNQSVSRFSQPPIIVFADDAVTDAAKLMRDKNAGSVLVAENVGKKDEPIGILTEWDLLTNIVAAGRDATQTRVREVMSSPVKKIEANARVSDALRIMLNRGIRRLAVMEEGVLIGTVTQSQLTGGGRQKASSAPPLTEKIKGHVCPYCNSTFTTRKKLSEHIETMHEESVFLELRDKQELETE